MAFIVRWLAVVSLVLAALWASLAADPPNPPAAKLKSPLTPTEARKALHVPTGLRVELVASEPQIESPVAAAFDEDGRLWVVEMRDYPNGPEKGQPPLGRLKLLEDKDGDGFFETSSVFADNLLFANGVMPWKGGVIVTAAPHIVYLKDVRRTGKADTREVLYEGFATENPQLRVSHPELGLDNWVYVANGLRGGKVQRAGKPGAAPLNISGMDFRFDPLGDRAETETGMGQYGNTFDDWGHRFVCTNRNHIVPIVLPNRSVQRNPFLAPPEPMRDNQGLGGAARVYPLSSNFTTASAHAGEFTSSCSVTIYRGDLLPASYRGAAFTCEPAGNLVHMESLSPDGASFRWHSAFDKKEFLASADDWFRPVNLFHGPDGALYVIDMYRAVIEHPQFMPPELRNRPDLVLGRDKGRIWRIVPENYQHAAARSPSLSAARTAELVPLLKHENAWWRTTAHRLLLERGDKTVAESLRDLCKAADPGPGPVHAAWLLDAWSELDPNLIHALSINPNPRIREQAAQLAERSLPQSGLLQNRLRELTNDQDARVRYQVALTLGAWDDDRILKPLAKIAWAGIEDRWTRAAIATAVPKRAGALVAVLLHNDPRLPEHTSPARSTLVHELAVLVGARSDAGEVADVLDALGKLKVKDALAWQLAGLNGLAEGMGRRGTQLGSFLANLPEKRRDAGKRATELLTEAATVAGDRKRPGQERIDAVRLMAHAPWTVVEKPLAAMIQEDPVQEVRLAAVRALAAQPRKEVPALLMKSWGSYTPAVRREVLEAMLRQPDRIVFLLDEVEAKRIRAGDIDALRSRQLVNHSRPEIRDRARRLLQKNLPADRTAVLEKYRSALKLKPDAPNGRNVFQKNCSTCHRIAGIGVEVGPNIADTLGKTPEALLLDILVPNAAIDNNYINYTVTTKSGKVLTGIIAQETASSLTLRRAENQTDVVLRQDIDEIQSTGLSLMPDGLEKNITLQEMADLLAFLKNWRFLDKPNP